MTEIFGNYIEDLPDSQEYLIIGFSPISAPLQQRWKTNGLSADFLADYISTFFPGNDDTNNSLEKKAEIRGAISYIANELLENAMKYNYDASSLPISIKLCFHGDTIIFQITNSIDPDRIKNFKNHLQELIDCDPEEMYIRQLEKNAIEENKTGGGLGFLTIVNDYGAKLGWKFQNDKEKPEKMTISTMVQLEI
jgi:hypothetical protein